MVSLRFPGIPPLLLKKLTDRLNQVPNPFSDRTSVEVLSHPEGLVFLVDGAYSFCRNLTGASDVELFQHFLQDPLQLLYMPVAYEIASQEVIPDILEKYVEIGGSAAYKIDWLYYVPKRLLLLRLPREVLAALYGSTGGTLTTRVHGTAGALRQIVTLRPILPEDVSDDEEVHRAFAIQYGKDAYGQALAAHQSVLREVISKPNLGISVGPVAVWTP